MENEFEMLMDIRSKLEAGESLTQSEQTLWEEWTKPYVRDDKFVDEDSFEELLEIYAQKKPFNEYWEELEKRMIRQQRARLKIPKLKRLRGIGKIHTNVMEFRKIAVAIIILTGIIVTTWPVFQSNDKEKERPSVDMGYHIIKVPPRSNKELILPDGSYVSLNAGSTLRYPDKFSRDKRVVELDGEAYFDIKHLDDNTPFYVITKDQEIKVTGTKFNVDDYYNNNFKKTTLLEGSVLIKPKSGTDHLYLLKPGQRSELLDGDKFTIGTSEEPAQATAWKRDSFYFENTPLTAIMTKLEIWYEVRIVFEEGIIDKRFTIGSISRKQPIIWVMQVLERTGGFKFKRENINIKKGDIIRIMKNDSIPKKKVPLVQYFIDDDQYFLETIAFKSHF